MVIINLKPLTQSQYLDGLPILVEFLKFGSVDTSSANIAHNSSQEAFESCFALGNSQWVCGR